MTPSAVVESDLLTEEAIVLLRAGDRVEACALLTRAVRVDPHNAQAWLWLAATVETVPQRRLCLEHVLALEPAHPLAVAALAALPPAPGLAEVVEAPSSVVEPAVRGRTPASPAAPRLRPAVALKAMGTVVEPAKKRWVVRELGELLQHSLQRPATA